MQKTIADAKTLLDGSAGQVADESTRDALAKAIDAAQKLLDGKSTDVAAMQNASKVYHSLYPNPSPIWLIRQQYLYLNRRYRRRSNHRCRCRSNRHYRR